MYKIYSILDVACYKSRPTPTCKVVINWTIRILNVLHVPTMHTAIDTRLRYTRKIFNFDLYDAGNRV